jgi:protein-S-isoprenylcysteine O-methyltransferase Ste14
MAASDSTRPNVLPWPPIIVVLSVLAAIILARLWPLPSFESGWLTMLGLAVALGGLALDLWALVTMRRADTNILPNKAADLLVTWGPFRFSRNPIYLANTVLLSGIGLTFDNLWFVVCALVAALAVDRLAIRREERHLAARFGTAWAEYSAKTPRWLI